jgi:asparagine synthase (glutamine-hydrolysing)
MCGIAGIISQNKSIVHYRALKKMTDALAHRGPDGEGFWINNNSNVGLAHRRLAIIDLSAAAAQPMHFAARYSIVYNGEIYNYKELRSDLQKLGYHFKTESDTEVILAGYDFYKESCVKYFDGMFAFGIWDEETQTLFCARDIFGEKPFYYFLEKDAFVFASEMKAMWALGVDKTIEEKMMVNYIALGYVQDAANKSKTFYKNIFSLPPAHIGLFTFAEMRFKISRYKDIDRHHTSKISENDAIEKLNQLLQTSINNRLRSDVPVGSSLSGGLDSSTIAYYIQKQQAQPSFKTFSAIFPGFEKDESNFIKELSEQFQIKNYTVTPNAKELVKDFEKVCYHQEEPFISSSIYAQYKVYELAKLHNVKVLLDGQGADEVLAGYTKYLHWYLQEMLNHNKFSFAKKELLALQKNLINPHWGIKNIFATYMPAHAALVLERREHSTLLNNQNISKELFETIKGKEAQGIHKPTVTKLNDILYYNTMEYGLEELLRYADRNSMAHGTEVRLPFLNFDLVSFVFSLPATFKINNGFSKNILRKAMQNKLPNKILWNPIKTGFEPPQKSWMTDKDLQELINDAKQKLVNGKILMPSVLDKKIQPQHTSEAENTDWRYLSLAQVL